MRTAWLKPGSSVVASYLLVSNCFLFLFVFSLSCLTVSDKEREDTVIVHMNWCGFTAFGHTLKRNMLVQSSHRSYLCCHSFHKRMIFTSTVSTLGLITLQSSLLLLVRMQRLKTLSWCKRWVDTTHRMGCRCASHNREQNWRGKCCLEARRLFNWLWQGKSNTIFAFFLEYIENDHN